jgi:hypothetical protein
MRCRPLISTLLPVLQTGPLTRLRPTTCGESDGPAQDGCRDGYTGLTREVDAPDSKEKRHANLGDYYEQKGESPSEWLGSGVAWLDMHTVGHDHCTPKATMAPSSFAAASRR